MKTNCPFCDVELLSEEALNGHLVEAHGYERRTIMVHSVHQSLSGRIIQHAQQEHGRALRALHESP